MDPKTRLGRNPFEAAKRPLPLVKDVAGVPAKKRVLATANGKGGPVTRARGAAHASPFVPDFVFHYAFEVPAHSAFVAIKACLLTFAVARELGNEARSLLS